MPETITRPDIDIDTSTREKLLPPWAVILHNDDVNSMDHVVRSLLRCIPSLTPDAAVEIMAHAHEHGQATILSCPKETAELYRGRLESCSLTATIEPA